MTTIEAEENHHEQRKFFNCIKLSEQFMSETNQSIRKLIKENIEIEKLISSNFVLKNDFEKDGIYYFIKERLSNDSALIRNTELFSIFGSKINVCMLKHRHYLILTNYIRELSDLPMIYCCNDDKKECLLRLQIDLYNKRLELKQLLKI